MCDLGIGNLRADQRGKSVVIDHDFSYGSSADGRRATFLPTRAPRVRVSGSRSALSRQQAATPLASTMPVTPTNIAGTPVARTGPIWMVKVSCVRRMPLNTARTIPAFGMPRCSLQCAPCLGSPRAFSANFKLLLS